MAHSNNSIITGKFQGMLGKELVFRDWDGKTIVAKAPAAPDRRAYGGAGENTGKIPAWFDNSLSAPGTKNRMAAFLPNKVHVPANLHLLNSLGPAGGVRIIPAYNPAASF